MKKILIAVAVVLLLGAGAYAAFSRGGSSPTVAPTALATPVVADNNLVAEAKVVPVRSAALSLPSGGVVAEELIVEGDQVQAGQPLLRLDRARAMATVAQAEAQLAQAQANLELLRAGATPEEIAAAEAQLRAAQAQQRQAGGSVTPADMTAAQAQLQQAQAHLAQLRAGPRKTDLQGATATLAQAQANLVTQRDQLSAAKTNAQLQLERAAADLTRAQSGYSTALQNWQYVSDSGQDPITPWLGVDSKTGKKIPNKLADAQRQQYYDAYIQAEAAMHSAEEAVTQAQVAYDTARQAEVSGIQMAEQQVAGAQASLDWLRAGATADELAAARAQLASSQAGLDKLSGDQRGGALDASQATVDQAQAALDKLRAGPSKSNLAVAAAEVQSAEAALKLAQVTAAEAELRAPFAGTVAALDMNVGEYVVPGTPVVQLADLSAWRIETSDLTELNVVRVHEGSPATVTFDAVPGLELPGKVSRIRPLGENKQGDVTYVVTIALDQQDPRLRWNMTASVTIAQ
jgi:HlyD family secretion protein